MEAVILNQVFEYILKGEIENALLFLMKLLSRSLHPDANEILDSIVRINTLYPVYDNHFIYNLYLDNKRKITRHDYFNMVIWLTPFKAQNIIYEADYAGGKEMIMNRVSEDMKKHPGGFLLGLGNSNYSLDYANKIKSEGLTFTDINATSFQFTLPYTLTSPEVGPLVDQTYDIPDAGVHFLFKKIKIFSEHPFFIHGIHNQVVISGNTLGHILDIYPGQKEVTFVQIVCKGISETEFTFRPDGDSVHVGIPNLSDERALYGQDYLPPKIKALKYLKQFIAEQSISIDDEKKELTIDSFSFFRVIFLNYEKKLALYHMSFFLTSSLLFNEQSNWYIGRIQKLGRLNAGFNENFKSISIDAADDLKNFINFLIEEVIVNSIIYKSGYKYLWADVECEISPKKETLVQPYLFNLIEYLCDIKGVVVVREPATAEGALDLLFTYTSPELRIFKVCLELKRAQHQHVSTAIKSQLKAYLDSQKTRLGIYLVLWFKYDDKGKFNLPAKYKNINELRLDIESNVPSGYDVDTIIIDCTKPTSPSQLH